MKRIKYLFMICFISFSFLGCSVLPINYGEPIEAQSFLMNVSADQVMNNISVMMNDVGYKVVQEDRSENYLVADGILDYVDKKVQKFEVSSKDKTKRYYLRYIFIVVNQEPGNSLLYIRGLIGEQGMRSVSTYYVSTDFLKRTLRVWGEELQKMSDL